MPFFLTAFKIFFLLLLKIIQEIMDRKINKKNKQNPQFRKEEIKLFLFAGDIILGTKNLREFTKNKIVRTNKFSKSAE